MHKIAVTLVLYMFAACATGAPKVPYPAFIQAGELPDTFLGGLPGVRAKQFSGDMRSMRMSTHLLIPPDWDFSTGAAPDKSVEIFVLAGEIEIGGISLHHGGYAFLPAGSMGARMRTRNGAEILYFLNDADERAVIEVPLITSIEASRWQALSDDAEDFGLAVMELRADPGSGAKTWLLKVEAVAQQSWQSYSADVEGYLVSGNYSHSECVAGKPVTESYAAGGYFLRPAGAVNGGPDAVSTGTSIWFLRSLGAGVRQAATCEGAP